MSDRFITDQNIADFHMFLIDEERSSGTIKKYIHDSRMFKTWLGECPVNKEKAAQWKRELIESGPSTGNGEFYAGGSQHVFSIYEMGGSAFEVDPPSETVFQRK